MGIEDDIRAASAGFDLVFSNELDAAKAHLSTSESPFHLMGLGVVAFLQAALGMETGMMVEASRLLTLAEAKAKKGAKTAKASPQMRRFRPGLDFEILQADAILLLGLTQALSESYSGYIQCLYSLNSAHSRFTKIYNTVFPDGVVDVTTPISTPIASSKSSLLEVPQVPNGDSTAPGSRGGFFSRWSPTASRTPSRSVTPTSIASIEVDGIVDELVIAGAAFGYGLFNLVLSLLPARLKGVVGFFGFKSDRSLALRALSVAATKNDVHGVFAGLTLMTYYGAVLLLSGYQADETHILKQYQMIVDKLQAKYPTGSLWILNSAKILRMSYDPDRAITVLQAGLAPERPHNFVQADALLIFELAWTLLSQRRYQESADMFLKMTEVNTWSHATYYFIAAGCYLSLGNIEKGKELLNNVPSLLEKRKLGGRDLPTEVFIKKKIDFYKKKQVRRGGIETDYVQSIRINLAEELGLFWNLHDRITLSTVEAHIREWVALSPPVTIDTPYVHNTTIIVEKTESTPHDLDTPDELALRSLLLGVVHRTISHFTESRAFLLDALKYQVEAKWVLALSHFELAVLQLKEAEALDKGTGDSLVPAPESVPVDEQSKALWKKVLQEAGEVVNRASEAASGTDLSSRLDTRIAMLRDEMTLKKKRFVGE